MGKISKYTILLICLLSLQACWIENNAVFAKESKKEMQARQRYMQEMGDSQPKEDVDYPALYNNLPDVNVEFIHEEDPDEYYDTQKLYFSPYPLIRLTQTLYVKKLVIDPGFYLLTPREYAGQRCVLFKQAGKIKYVVPIFEYKTVIPEYEYQKPEKKWWQIRDRYMFKTQYYERKLRAYDLYEDYYEIDLYYRSGLSKMIFKKTPY